jgi:hypothetical protein
MNNTDPTNKNRGWTQILRMIRSNCLSQDNRRKSVKSPTVFISSNIPVCRFHNSNVIRGLFQDSYSNKATFLWSWSQRYNNATVVIRNWLTATAYPYLKWLWIYLLLRSKCFLSSVTVGLLTDLRRLSCDKQLATDETDVDKLESEVTTLSQSSVFNPFEYKVKIKLRSIRLNKKMYYHKVWYTCI